MKAAESMHQALSQFWGVLNVVRASRGKSLKIMKAAEGMHQALNQFSAFLEMQQQKQQQHHHPGPFHLIFKATVNFCDGCNDGGFEWSTTFTVLDLSMLHLMMHAQ